jgi:hypothetical protein
LSKNSHQKIQFSESQLLAIGSGFVVLIAIAALFVAIQKRRQRRGSSSSRDFHSPLIQTLNSKPNKFRATSGSFGSSSSNGGSPILSPSSDSTSSPQCTPLMPYASFAVKEQAAFSQLNGHLPISEDRGSVSLSLNYDRNSRVLQVRNK